MFRKRKHRDSKQDSTFSLGNPPGSPLDWKGQPAQTPEEYLDQVVLNRLQPLLIVLTFLYVAFAVGHLLVLPPHAAIYLAPMALGSALLFAGSYFYLAHRPITPAKSHQVLTCIALLLLLNSAVHLLLASRAYQSTNFMLLLIGIGLLFTSTNHFISMLILVSATWVGLVFSGRYFTPIWVHYGFALLTTIVLSIIIFVVHRLTLLKIFQQTHELQKSGELLQQLVQEQTEELLAQNEQLQREVRERIYIEKELEAARDKAEASSKSKGESINIASHELRTPLTSLLLWTQEIRRLVEQERPVPVEVINRIEKQVNRLRRMINDLLNVSRLERNTVVLHPSRADLNDVVREVVDDFCRQVTDRQIKLQTTASPVTVEADVETLSQVLYNLLDNAVKYSPNGSPVDVAVLVEDEQAKVTVTDRGSGIPMEDLETIFLAFMRGTGPKTDKKQGLGLGLYVSSRIVESHGGTMGVTSSLGKGSTFHFTLPLAVPSSDDLP